MKSGILLAVLLSSCLLLTSCGGGSGSSSVPSKNLTSGNWSIFAASTVTPSSPVIGMNGSVVQSGSTVTAVLHMEDSTCFSVQ